MAGGHWGKGQNPYFNYDFDAAASHAEKLSAESITQRAKSDAESARNDASKLRNQAIHKSNDLNKAKQDLNNAKEAFYRLVIRSNILNKSLDKLISDHPELKEEILDTIQDQRDLCIQQDYKQKWWDWIQAVDLNFDMDYLKFPYEKRGDK